MVSILLFKKELIDAFTTSSGRLILAAKLLTRHQSLDEFAQSYYYNVLTLCKRFSPKMSESDRVLYLLRRIKPKIAQNVIMFNAQKCSESLELAKRTKTAVTLPQSITPTPTSTTILADEDTTTSMRSSN
ncbi:unnamed protein product [Didymodactylos carnosus]|uniref:Uncharacterized protein n=1 Tax=Didymodactylos carnosus TaxID=1234261 RepID=A0A8S2EZQ0_9BILA|nr:unnamed protein product [Didymodactylos carnosus]CAF4122945.1 unnamed protein product [Didymodactylos carnosus]